MSETRPGYARPKSASPSGHKTGPFITGPRSGPTKKYAANNSPKKGSKSSKKDTASKSPEREQQGDRGSRLLKSGITSPRPAMQQQHQQLHRSGTDVDPFMDSKLVHSLNQSTFQNFLQNKDAVLVMFYEPRSSLFAWSKKHFIKAAAKTVRENHAYAAVNCSKEKQLCEGQSVDIIPLFKLYSRGTPMDTIREANSFGCDLMRQQVENAPVATEQST